jgi:PurA ssDNA and RNA-binding protein
MISNDRSSPYGNRAYGERPPGDRPYGPPKPPVNEDTLRSAKIQIERKTFVLALKENPRGRFLRITEDVGGRRDTIIIPAPGLDEFRALLDEMVKASAETPPKAEPSPE